MDTLQQHLFARARPLVVSRAYTVLWWSVGAVAAFWIWASWATLDEQVRAPGTVIVSSRSQVVQSVDGGVLRTMHVREGDTVQKGDLLAELDTIRFQASADEVVAKVTYLKATIQRLEAELDETDLHFSKDIAAYPDIVQAQTRLFERRRKFQREETEAIEKSLKLAEQELAAIENLAETGDASQSELLKARRAVVELSAQMTNKKNTYRQEAQAELAKSRSELESNEQVLTQRNEALQSTKLRAPMSGVVKNVRITTVGAVLREGEEILQIVPSDEPMIIEAKVKSRDVAFIRKGLRANVKLDAYDYTVYGSLVGHVTYISPDTLEDEKKRDEDPTFRVHIEITEFPEKSKEDIEVIPGMTASVEIITGERTVAQYLLKPLRRVSSAALVER